ncbi:peptidoglycan-binding protein [Salibacterium halotolerans]|uniref:Putative peptidoglycan binding domain-containing protein n=1 Tax=Salibacterium halotolerans TaxID=1884432 RepID=A0A1I5X5J3_9BACI|nr:peptidoglycan-binding protein [Salibacterium halotolerans]SFQ27161.1 Putative peptidoglycan binding domain-containing protein [Salibacterium halotolerans]
MFDTTMDTKKLAAASAAAVGALAAVPSVADGEVGDTMLSYGMENEDVQELQERLRDRGHYTYETVSGVYDTSTVEAVKSFQRAHQLTVDGIAGPETFGVLLQRKTEPTARTSGAFDREDKKEELGSTTVMRTGEESSAVRELQRRLQNLGLFEGGQHGYYGRRTANAVKSFQRDAGIVVDGIAGPQTFAAMRGVIGSVSSALQTEPASESTFRILESGDKGSEVSLLQRQLKDLGFYNKDVTGVYGPMTEESVRRFQQKQGLTTDGLAGPKTFNALKNNPEPASESRGETQKEASAVGSSSMLRYEDSGEEVTGLQERLRDLDYMKMEPSGVFSGVTEKAVKSFQKEQGLVVDGIAGPRTQEKMDEMLETGEEREEPDAAVASSDSDFNAVNLVADASEHIGTPYVWGGTSESGFDCSGFLQYVFNENGVELPRTVADIYNEGTSVEKPKVGDIIFFKTYNDGPSHAGIYTGNDQFIHAGTSTGVTVSDKTDDYWAKRYIGAKRY